jgi:hypothetical protein
MLAFSALTTCSETDRECVCLSLTVSHSLAPFRSAFQIGRSILEFASGGVFETSPANTGTVRHFRHGSHRDVRESVPRPKKPPTGGIHASQTAGTNSLAKAAPLPIHAIVPFCEIDLEFLPAMQRHLVPLAASVTVVTATVFHDGVTRTNLSRITQLASQYTDVGAASELCCVAQHCPFVCLRTTSTLCFALLCFHRISK